MTKVKNFSKKNLPWKSIFSQTISFIRETPVSWIFGFILSLPGLAVIILESFFFQSQGTDSLLMVPKIMGLFLSIFFLFFIAEAGLILSFKRNTYSSIEHMAAAGALLRWYFLFLFILLSLFALFFSPFIIAPPEIQSTLKYISFIFFLFVASASFILKMFGEFYLILSKLSLGSAFRSASNLFSEHFSSSVMIFAVTSIISINVSFLSGILHIYLDFPLSDMAILNTVIILLILAISSFFNIFIRTFWYFSFQTLAAEKPSDWQKAKKMVEESMTPAEDEV